MVEDQRYESLLDQYNELQKEVSEYRALVDNSPDLIYRTDLEGRITFVSPSVERLAGYTVEEALGLKMAEDVYLYPQEREQFLDILRKTGEVRHFEARLKRRDGSIWWASTNARFFRDSSGEVGGVEGVARDISDVKTAENALRESKERYGQIFQIAPSGIYEIDYRSGKIVNVNDTICEYLGYTREELLAIDVKQLLTEESHERFLRRLENILNGVNVPPTTEYTAIRKDGSEMDVIISTRFLYEGDAIVGATVVAQDITERKRAERALRASEKRFRNIVNASPMGIHLYELNAEDRLVFTGANHASDELLGISHQRFLGMTVEEAFPGLAQTEVPDRYREAAKHGTPWRSEHIEYDDGRFRGAYEVAAFQTEPGKMAAMFNDITDRKKAEWALHESEERFRTLVEESPLGIALIGKDGRYHYVNPSFERIFGYTLADIPTGKDWFRRAFPDEAHRRRVMSTWIDDQKTAGIGVARPREYQVRCRDGSDKEINFRPVTMENRDQFVIYEDITEKRRIEQQFQQAQKFEAIGTLAGGIAHDFNNLLMGIQGRSSLIAVDVDPGHPYMEHLRAIEGYIKSAVNLTKQLLGFARGGRYEVKTFNVNSLVQDSATMFGRTRKELNIHFDTRQPIIPIQADYVQIEQVLLNIYVNAWHAMPDGGDIHLQTRRLTIEQPVSTTHGIEPGEYALISITDNGIGMDRATCQRVFDPFFTTKDKSRGTGLGLASAYGIISNHNGAITVYSELGHGTTFNIYLPVSDQDIQQDLSPEHRLLRGAETILVVDDEEIIIDVSRDMLERLGYRVKACRGGQEAIDTVADSADAIDLVILDLIMPGMDGGRVFDEVRKINPRLPVILSSGYAINGQATDILARGCDGFIQKPFNINELSQKVRDVLDAAAR